MRPVKKVEHLSEEDFEFINKGLFVPSENELGSPNQKHDSFLLNLPDEIILALKDLTGASLQLEKFAEDHNMSTEFEHLRKLKKIAREKSYKENRSNRDFDETVLLKKAETEIEKNELNLSSGDMILLKKIVSKIDGHEKTTLKTIAAEKYDFDRKIEEINSKRKNPLGTKRSHL